MDKEAVVHIHHGILLSHKKEHTGVSSNEVDETGAHYTEQEKNRPPAQAGCMRRVLGPGALGRPRGIGWRGR